MARNAIHRMHNNPVCALLGLPETLIDLSCVKTEMLDFSLFRWSVVAGQVLTCVSADFNQNVSNFSIICRRTTHIPTWSAEV
jgi:hypothetical protein